MTTEDAKEYMNKLEIPQLFENTVESIPGKFIGIDSNNLIIERLEHLVTCASMLTGLLYNKPEDPLKFLGDCISNAKDNSNLKWDTFIDLNKKPLPAIARKSSGPIRSENYASLGDDITTGQTKTFETEPILEMKIQTKLPAIKRDTSDFNAEDITQSALIVPENSEIGSENKSFGNQKVIFVLGGPGSGKGTQCDKIVHQFGYQHLSAGELLREEITKQNDRATLISEAIKEGKLVPQEITIELLKDAMLRYPESPGFLIDGFPRELSQGHQFENEVVQCDMVLYFECSEDEMKERILKRGESSGRSDDNVETIQKRFETFFEKTIPVLDYYESINKLRKISATGEVEKIFQRVCDVFNQELSQTETGHVEEEKHIASSVEKTVDKKFRGQRIVFVLGGPGSGKGTQCDKIVETFGFAHFSTGDLLRHEVKKDNDRTKMMNEIMNEGKLVPQEIILELLNDAMSEDTESPGFLLDGFPRDLAQGRQFNDEIADCDMVLFFECSEQVMEERLLKRGETSGRADDNSETIKKRFKTYIDETLPVIEYYEINDKVRRIDATRDVNEVFEDVCKIFGAMLEQSLANEQKTEGKPDREGFNEAVEELYNYAGDLSLEQNKGDNEENETIMNDDRTLIDEPVITSEDITPLGNLGIPVTTGTAGGLLNVRVIFVIGGPGCGKGTQCSKIIQDYGYTHLSTGDLLRSEVQSASSRGEHLKQMMEQGELVPMEIILEMLRDAIIRQPNTRGFLIDGFPRELCQAVQFEKQIAESECVLYYKCASETMTERLLKRAETSGRVDDNEETIKKRLESFFNQTIPVVEHYEEKHKLHKIHAERSPEEIFKDTKSILDALPSRFSTATKFDVVFLTGDNPSSNEIAQELAEKNGRTFLSYPDFLKECESSEQESIETNINKLIEKLTNDDSRRFLIAGFPNTVEQLEHFEKFSDFKLFLCIGSQSKEEDEALLGKIEVLGKLKKIPGNLSKEEIISNAQLYLDL